MGDRPSAYLEGELVLLRGLERSDLTAQYLAWLNDPDVNRHLFVGRAPSTRESLEAFFDGVVKNPNVVMFAIIERESGRHIGNVKLEMYDTVSRVVDWGIVIGEKELWGRGICQEVARLTTRYAFDRLNAHKITLGVSGGHDSAVAAYENVGFQVEGRQRQQIYEMGRYVDKVLMGLLRGDLAIEE